MMGWRSRVRLPPNPVSARREIRLGLGISVFLKHYGVERQKHPVAPKYKDTVEIGFIALVWVEYRAWQAPIDQVPRWC